MVDFHTHILPGIDDGSDSLDTTLKMLDEMRKQDIKTIVATPHFAPQTEAVSAFLERREAALQLVSPHLNGLTIIPAAEVKYCRNISKIEGIEKAALGNLGYILIEMTYQEWTKQTVDDVIAIMDNTGLIPILAHVDRYWNNNTKKHFEVFLDAGVLMQFNVSSFEGFFQERKFIKLIREGKIHLLGSDCHNMKRRIPNLKSGFDILEKHGLVSLIEAHEEIVFNSESHTSSNRIII